MFKNHFLNFLDKFTDMISMKSDFEDGSLMKNPLGGLLGIEYSSCTLSDKKKV